MVGQAYTVVRLSLYLQGEDPTRLLPGKQCLIVFMWLGNGPSNHVLPCALGAGVFTPGLLTRCWGEGLSTGSRFGNSLVPGSGSIKILILSLVSFALICACQLELYRVSKRRAFNTDSLLNVCKAVYGQVALEIQVTLEIQSIVYKRYQKRYQAVMQIPPGDEAKKEGATSIMEEEGEAGLHYQC